MIIQTKGRAKDPSLLVLTLESGRDECTFRVNQITHFTWEAETGILQIYVIGGAYENFLDKTKEHYNLLLSLLGGQPTV